MPVVGDTLSDRYRIEAPLGAGGMATVHRARDLRLSRDVAVKILLPNLARDPLLAQRFDREARALASVRHAGIVAVHDVDPGDPSTGREPFFVMELCEGGSLADRLADAPGGTLSPDELVPIVVAVAGGLAELHGSGIVHRDVKPHNILLSATGAKLGDFGVVRDDTLEATSLTSDGSTVGTLAYLAPEVLGGEPATPASDVYALAVVAYQAMTGRLPRAASNWAQLVEHRAGPVLPASAVAPGLGTAFDAVLGAALVPEKASRPEPLAFASALASALGRWSRSRTAADQRIGWPVPPIAVRAGASTVGPDAPTLLSVPLPARSPATRAPAARSPAAPAPAAGSPAAGSLARRLERLGEGRMAFAVIGTAVLVAGFMIVAALLARGPGTSGGSPGPSGPAAVASPSTSPPPSPSPLPSPLPSPTPSPSPSPTPTPDPLAEARPAIVEARAAIVEAQGGRRGLKGNDANDLQNLVDRVERALEAGELGQASEAAGSLVERVEGHIRRRDVTGDRATRLLDAARALRDAIPGD